MCKPWFCLTIAMSLLMMASCTLSNPPECRKGEQKCVDEGLLSLVLSCNSAYQWNRMVCATGCADDKKKCREVISGCSKEGEYECVETSSGINIELKCVRGSWIPAICASGSHCENNRCSELDGQCKSGQAMCLDGVNGHSLAIGCSSEGYWESMYCATTTCDPQTKKCKAQSESACAGKNDGEKCDKGDHSVATCYHGTCISTSCEDGYHSSGSGCLEDSKTECGKKATDCTAIAHVGEVECVRGVCEISSCEGEYEVVNKSACVSAGVLSCGDAHIDCSQIASVADVNCVAGKCEVISCVPGMHPNQTKDGCDPDVLTACGSDLKDCSSINDAKDAKCENGHCVVTDCLYGKHVSEDMSRCVDDLKTSCGFEGRDCTKIDGASEVICMNGGCSVQSCLPGRHVAAGGQLCELDTEENCGSSHTNCKGISAAKDVSCVSGVCKVNSCHTGHHPDTSGSLCESDDVENCGGMNCKSGNVLSATCVSGACVVSSCAIGYHVSSDKTGCISDADECLESLYIDTTDGIYSNSNVKCINGDITMAENTKKVELPSLETVSGVICNKTEYTASGIYAEGLEEINLPKLKTAGGISFLYSQLTTISLPSLTTNNGYFTVSYNTLLTRIDAPLLETSRSFVAYANTINDGTYKHSNLKEINLPKLVSTSDLIEINCNYELDTIDLSSLTTVGKRFQFDAQEALGEIKLPKLESVGDGISFYHNDVITNIEMPKLNNVTGVFMITSDPKLSCAVPCGFKNVPISESVYIKRLLEENCDYDSDKDSMSFAEFCSGLGY